MTAQLRYNKVQGVKSSIVPKLCFRLEYFVLFVGPGLCSRLVDQAVTVGPQVCWYIRQSLPDAYRVGQMLWSQGPAIIGYWMLDTDTMPLLWDCVILTLECVLTVTSEVGIH